MKTKDSYIAFINDVNNLINYYHSELTFSINMASILSTSIMKCTNTKVIDYFNTIEFLEKFNINDLKQFEIEPFVQAAINNYKHYIEYKIPYLQYNLEIYLFLSSISYNIYHDIIGKYNEKLIHNVLEGNTSSLFKMGKLKILCVNKTTNRKILDYNKTKINKKYFEDNNLTGDYRVYNTDSEFSFFKLFKFMRLKTLQYYHFEPTDFNNMVDRKIDNYYKLKKSDNDILNNEKIGNLQKMNSLIKNNAMYKLKYNRNAN